MLSRERSYEAYAQSCGFSRSICRSEECDRVDQITPKRKPSGFHTEGQGIDRKVIPHFAPQGQIGRHSNFVHPSREAVHQARQTHSAWHNKTFKELLRGIKINKTAEAYVRFCDSHPEWFRVEKIDKDTAAFVLTNKGAEHYGWKNAAQLAKEEAFYDEYIPTIAVDDGKASLDISMPPTFSKGQFWAMPPVNEPDKYFKRSTYKRENNYLVPKGKKI